MVTVFEWPDLPGEAAVRAGLRAWAEATRHAPDDLFDGPLELVPDTLVNFLHERLLETRREYERELPSSAALPSRTYLGPISDLVIAPPASSADESVSTFLREDSVRTVGCVYCESGRIRCQNCGGATRVPCPPRVPCRECTGLGRNLEGRICELCRGAGSFVCERCRGAGFITCPACRGNAVGLCANCAGSGMLVRFMEGRIERAKSKRWFTCGGESFADKSSEDDDWIDVSFPAAEVPQGLPDRLAEDIDRDLGRREQGQIAHSLRAEVLPLLRVRALWEGRTIEALIVGRHSRIAPPSGFEGLRGAFGALRRFRRKTPLSVAEATE